MIIADWKTGKFKNPSQLASHYKVDRKTVGKIIEGISQEHTAVVEAGAIYEKAKKSLKNPVEITAIEKAVEEMTIADEIESVVNEGTLINVRGVKEVLTEHKEQMNMYDRKTAQETLDKALITSGKASRHASQKTDISVNNQNIQNNIAINWE